MPVSIVLWFYCDYHIKRNQGNVLPAFINFYQLDGVTAGQTGEIPTHVIVASLSSYSLTSMKMLTGIQVGTILIYQLQSYLALWNL